MLKDLHHFLRLQFPNHLKYNINFIRDFAENMDAFDSQRLFNIWDDYRRLKDEEMIPLLKVIFLLTVLFAG